MMRIKTFKSLKKAFGGTDSAAAKALGMSRQLYSHSKLRGYLPPDRYFIHLDIITKAGHTVDRKLWGFAEPEQQKNKGAA